ncbi:Uncharacterized HIT-like protein RP317 [Candidatus Xenohaliotis californiensis]|uniref:Uncharacterized HIT-like protein RP317 n=1 Tax=Candidatus Xenohaliotis californiensis TaxID=84677 RepID=A0ABM9N739_9RICK|nr:Uncharacterized HIT-like protein RP317 [Candidatus Xenohaliotis californiensis]
MNTKYNNENIFYKIIHKIIDCKVIYEDDVCIAINDINPCAPVHILLLPKNNYISFNDFIITANSEEICKIFKAAHKIAQINNLEKNGYRIVMNHGHNASQTVMHFHIHVIGGRKIYGLCTNDDNKR